MVGFTKGFAETESMSMEGSRYYGLRSGLQQHKEH